MLNTRLLTSMRMQALEYRQRWLLLLIVLSMPAVLFAANYYSVPAGEASNLYRFLRTAVRSQSMSTPGKHGP